MDDNSRSPALPVVRHALTRAANYFDQIRQDTRKFDRLVPENASVQAERTSVGYEILKLPSLHKQAARVIVELYGDDCMGLRAHFGEVVKDMQSRKPQTREMSAEGVIAFLDRCFGPSF